MSLRQVKDKIGPRAFGNVNENAAALFRERSQKIENNRASELIAQKSRLEVIARVVIVLVKHGTHVPGRPPEHRRAYVCGGYIRKVDAVEKAIQITIRPEIGQDQPSR